MNRTFRITLMCAAVASASLGAAAPVLAKKAALNPTPPPAHSAVAAAPAVVTPPPSTGSAVVAAPAGNLAPAKGKALAAVRAANLTIAKQLKQKPVSGSAEETKLAAAVTETVRGFIDLDILATRAILEAHWAAANVAQRKEYLTVLRALLEDNYVRGMRSNLDFTVEYTGEVAAPNGNAVIVQTVIKAKRKGRPYSIKVDYTVEANRAGGVYVVDIATDGVGLIDNYRSQFTKIINKDGFNGLLAKMKKKLATAK